MLRTHYTKEKGSHMVSISKIPQGKIIHKEMPICLSPSPIMFKESDGQCRSQTASICVICYTASSQEYSCKRCHLMYCSEKCKKSDESLHTTYCTQNICHQPLYLAMRALAKGIRLPVLFEDISYDRIAEEQITKDVSMILFRTFGFTYSYEYLEKYLRVIYRYIFCMKTFICKHLYGYALYLFASYFNHSCDPNTYYYFVKGEIIARAAREIQPGEGITISYNEGAIFTTPDVRSNVFRITFGRSCFCDRCTSKTRVVADERIMTFRKDKSPHPNKNEIKYLNEMQNLSKLNIHDVLKYEAMFDRLYSKTHAMRSEMYHRFLMILFQRGVTDAIRDFGKKFEEFLTSLRACKIVQSTLPFVVWARFMTYLLESIILNDEHIDELERGLPRRKPKKGMLDIVQHALDANYAISTYFDLGIFDVDIKVYPFVKVYLDIMKSATWKEVCEIGSNYVLHDDIF